MSLDLFQSFFSGSSVVFTQLREYYNCILALKVPTPFLIFSMWKNPNIELLYHSFNWTMRNLPIFPTIYPLQTSSIYFHCCAACFSLHAPAYAILYHKPTLQSFSLLLAHTPYYLLHTRFLPHNLPHIVSSLQANFRRLKKLEATHKFSSNGTLLFLNLSSTVLRLPFAVYSSIASSPSCWSSIQLQTNFFAAILQLTTSSFSSCKTI